MSSLKIFFGYYRCHVCMALSRATSKNRCEHCYAAPKKDTKIIG